MSRTRMTIDPPYCGVPNLSHQFACVADDEVVTAVVLTDLVVEAVFEVVEVVEVQAVNTGTETRRMITSKNKSSFLFISILIPFLFLSFYYFLVASRRYPIELL